MAQSTGQFSIAQLIAAVTLATLAFPAFRTAASGVPPLAALVCTAAGGLALGCAVGVLRSRGVFRVFLTGIAGMLLTLLVATAGLLFFVMGSI